MSAGTLFERVARAVEHDPPDGKRGFGEGALKAGGKIFAMLVDERLVLKLPRARVEELVVSAAGTPFDPGQGRVMREWVVLSSSDEAEWIRLAGEARRFVAP